MCVCVCVCVRKGGNKKTKKKTRQSVSYVFSNEFDIFLRELLSNGKRDITKGENIPRLEADIFLTGR